MADYSINNIYSGGESSLDPNKNYGSILNGYGVGAGQMGITTDPRSANILKEITTKLSTGVKQMEVEGLSPEVFDSIPNSHLKEANRLAKLTGAELSLHAPLIDAAGLSQQQTFTDKSREESEIAMINTINRAHELNPKGNIPVTFHSAVNLPSPEMFKGEKGKEISAAFVVDTERGSMGKIPLNPRHFIGEPKNPDIKTELKELNEEKWMGALRDIEYYASIGMRDLEGTKLTNSYANVAEKEGVDLEEIGINKMGLDRGSTFLSDSYRRLQGLFENAYRHGTEQDKKNLDELNKKIQENVLLLNKQMKENPESVNNLELMKKIITQGVNSLKKIEAPKVYIPADEFIMDKTTDTFSNVALYGYKKFKENAPIISIENPPIGMGFSTGEDLKKIVEETRDKFVKKAVEIGVMSKSQAEKEAEKLIGVTWDVGHINMLRKKGFETKDILKETEKVAPLVKHIHLSDNFGMEHTELPMGMGNVPIKEIMEKLGKEGFDAKKIIEAGNWWQHFQTSPVQQSFEAFGSPMYAEGAGPYWSQTSSLYQGYSSGFGQMLPQINYSTFGAGFSRLPSELGGNIPGQQGSRLGGTPME